MNYDDDLNAPVWDELGDKNASTADELSKSFANLSAEEPTEQPSTEQSKDVSNMLVDTSKETGTWDVNNKGTPAKDELMRELAPEGDAHLEFQASMGALSVVSPKKTRDEPLFSGSTYLPLATEDDQNIEKDNTSSGDSQGDVASPHRATGKPQVLFNSARIRRRPLSSVSELNNKQGLETDIADPLGEIKKEGEFVDEPLEEQSSLPQKDSKSNTILEQVNEPLFKLSPKKKTNIKSTYDEELNVDANDANAKSDENEGAVKEVVKFEIEVKDPIKVGELTSAHVEYTVVAESELLEGKYAQVNRRYTDFRWLYRQLQSNHWGMIIPPPPEKQTMGRFKQDFIENRRFQMERMLRRIASTPALQNDPDFILFLTSTDFDISAKKREHVTGSGASNDNKDLSEIHISEIQLLGAEDAVAVLKNGGLDGESQKRFMSISFSSAPKYIEADEFFIQQWQNTETLEEELRQLDKSLELVDSERNELASVTEEFAKTVESLSALEVTKKSSDLLSNFAETHRRIKETLERGSLQEALTLGVTLDEYIRLLASLKAILNQRAKLGHYLVIVESELTRKQAQLQKLNTNSQTVSDRATVVKKEYQTLQKRFEMIKQSWQKVGNRIKMQIKTFEAEKVKDFRNSMEIFLESAIESQKEAIELWETFYQTNL